MKNLIQPRLTDEVTFSNPGYSHTEQYKVVEVLVFMEELQV
jgi:hypothetical protein